MKNSVSIIILLILVSLQINVLGQSGHSFFNNTTLPSEAVAVFTDRDIYVSGERIWFSAYCSTNISNILYVEIYSSEQQVIVQKMFYIHNHSSQGSIVVPNTAATDTYTLRAYTYYQHNFPIDKIFRKPLYIFNPEMPQQATLRNRSGETSPLGQQEETDIANLKIIIADSNFMRRDKIHVDFNLNNGSADSIVLATISVTKKGAVAFPDQDLAAPYYPDSLRYLPEFSGPVLHGFLSGKEKKNRTIYLSIPGKQPIVRLVDTDEKGAFQLPIFEYDGTKTICITTPPDTVNPIEINIQSNYNQLFPINESYPEINIPSKLLSEIFRNSQVKKSYNTETITQYPYENDLSGLFGIPPISIALHDFIDLNSLEEVFFEIVPFVKIRRHKGHQSLSVLDDRNDMLFHNPLVLLDNVPIFSTENLFLVHPAKIDSIKVINRNYAYGSYALDGVIMVISKTDNFGTYEFTKPTIFLDYAGIEQVTLFHHQKYSTEKSLNAAMPDFRTTLLWIPHFSLENAAEGIDFYASDDCSDYEIIVRYITANGASRIAKKTLSVGNRQEK